MRLSVESRNFWGRHATLRAISIAPFAARVAQVGFPVRFIIGRAIVGVLVASATMRARVRRGMALLGLLAGLPQAFERVHWRGLRGGGRFPLRSIMLCR
jgi:hypothetical protein